MTLWLRDCDVFVVPKAGCHSVQKLRKVLLGLLEGW
jgi:hypothetical protein